MAKVLGINIGNRKPAAAIQPAAAVAPPRPTLEEEINKALGFVEKQPPSRFSDEEATKLNNQLAEYQTAEDEYWHALASFEGAYDRMSAAELVGMANASQGSAKKIVSDISEIVNTIKAKRVGAIVRESGEEITPEAIKAHIAATRDLRIFHYVLSLWPETISDLIGMGDKLTLETAVGATPGCVSLIRDAMMKETPEYKRLSIRKGELATLNNQLKNHVNVTRMPERHLIDYVQDAPANTALSVHLYESQDRQRGIVTYSGNVFWTPVVTFKSDDPKYLRLDVLARASEKLVLNGLKVTYEGDGKVLVNDTWKIGVNNGTPIFYFGSELASDSPQVVTSELQVLRIVLPVLFGTVAAATKGELYSKAAPAKRA